MTNPTTTQPPKTVLPKTKATKTKLIAKTVSPDYRPVIDNKALVTPIAGPKGKIGLLITMLRQTGGATINAMMIATGWQAHSVRGALSGSVKKAHGLSVTSEKTEEGRIYRIVGAGA